MTTNQPNLTELAEAARARRDRAEWDRNYALSLGKTPAELHVEFCAAVDARNAYLANIATTTTCTITPAEQDATERQAALGRVVAAANDNRPAITKRCKCGGTTNVRRVGLSTTCADCQD
jgi:hypothetical protein